MTQRTHNRRGAFTVIELLIVISVIAIIAGIVTLSYGGWRGNTLKNQVKSDLSAAASAMESARNFGAGYPTSLPSTFTPSADVTVALTSSTTTTYCLDGTATATPSVAFYINSIDASKGPQTGTCAGSPAPTAPPAPINLTISSTASSSVGLTWTAGSGGGTPSSYLMQCASEPAFVNYSGQGTSTTTSGVVSGLVSVSNIYCRVRATNSAGSSAWSNTASTNTGTFSAPTGLAATGTTSSSLTLSWSTNTDAVTYTIQCSQDNTFASGVLSQSIANPTVTATFTGLPFNTPYSCRVNAVNTANTSSWSSTLATTTVNAYGSLAVGTSIEGYWTTAPTGYLLENGAAVSRTTYADLFAVIGTTYGSGDGSTTFNLPDSRGKTYVNRLVGDPYFATLGQSVGSKTLTLSLAQIPAHTHLQYSGGIDDKNFTGYQIAGQYPPGDGPGLYNPGTTTGATGGGGAHNNIQPSIVKTYAIKYAPIDSAVATLTAGTSIHGYWASAPTGYLLEDGSAVSRTTYSALFAAIGTTYGAGDGSTTFNLPDSRSRASVNLSASDVEFNAMGKKYGEETHTLTLNELPSHSHPIWIGTIDDKNWTGYSTGANQYSPGDAAGQYNTSTFTGNTGSGSGAAHSVIQPSIVQNSAIKFAAETTGSMPAVTTATSVTGYWASAPSGYLVEDGSAVSRTTYAALFAAIGTTYGAGDGSTTFNVPDSRGRLGVNLNTSDAEFSAMGQKYGEKAHTLTIPEMPSHTHTMSVGTVDDQNFTNGVGQYAPADGPGAYNTGIVSGPAGGGQAFNVIQNSIVKLFVIKF